MKTTRIGMMASAAPEMKVIATVVGAGTRRSSARSRGGQARDGEAAHDLTDLARQTCVRGGLVATADGFDDDPAHSAHLVRAEAARRRGGRPDPDARGRVRGQSVEGDRVLVDGDPDLVEEVFRLLAGDPSGVTSTSRRWLSVPPETTRAASPASVSAM